MGSERNKELEEWESNYDKNDADGDGQWSGFDDEENSGGKDNSGGEESSGGDENSGDNNNRFERSPSLPLRDQEILRIKKLLKRNATLTIAIQENVQFIEETDGLGHARSHNKWIDEGKNPEEEWARYLKVKRRTWGKTRRRLAKKRRDMESELAKLIASS